MYDTTQQNTKESGDIFPSVMRGLFPHRFLLGKNRWHSADAGHCLIWAVQFWVVSNKSVLIFFGSGSQGAGGEISIQHI